jgi:hypothetical protein
MRDEKLVGHQGVVHAVTRWSRPSNAWAVARCGDQLWYSERDRDRVVRENAHYGDGGVRVSRLMAMPVADELRLSGEPTCLMCLAEEET